MNLDVSKVLTFLFIPHSLIAWIFASIILSIVIIVIFLNKKNANPLNWEKNWRHGDDKTSSGIKYLSSLDASYEVETTSEKISEILPGVLLIVGLLGTFIGLGIALDSAASVLGNGKAATEKMGELSGLMSALGAKFQTSTWGIIAFLCFKSWHLKQGSSDKRLSWCVKKINLHISNQEIEKIKLDNKKQQLFLDNINLVHKEISNTIQNQITASNEIKKQAIFDSKESNSQLMNLLSNQFELVNKQNSNLILETIETKKILFGFVADNKANIQEMKNSTAELSKAAQSMGESAIYLNTSISAFEGNVTSVMNSLKNDLNQSISKLNTDMHENLKSMGSDLSSSTKGISNAVSTFSENMKTSLNKMNTDLDINMTTMSNNLKSATDNIGVAVTGFSKEMGGSVLSIVEANEKSGKTQQKMLSAFESASDDFSESMIKITNEIENSSKTVSQGLTSISAGNLKMLDFFNTYKEIPTKITTAITEINTTDLEMKKFIDGMIGVLNSYKLIPDKIIESSNNLKNEIVFQLTNTLSELKKQRIVSVIGEVSDER
jgi:hypothetical protein